MSDAQWERIAPLLQGRAGDPSRFGEDNRLFVEAVIGNKLFDSDWLRAEFNERRVLAVIPPNGRRVGTISCNQGMDERRHLVENFFQKIIELRRVVTHCDRVDTSFRAAIHLVASLFVPK